MNKIIKQRVAIALLVITVLITSSCATQNKAKKHKGYEPCPCEKNK